MIKGQFGDQVLALRGGDDDVGIERSWGAVYICGGPSNSGRAMDVEDTNYDSCCVK